MTPQPKTDSPKTASKSAKRLYQPIGITSSIIGGLIAGQVFKQGWKHAAPQGNQKAPKALDTGISFKEVLVAALIQGAVFALVKALLHRGGARLFEKVTGEWPGN
ncbi:DUF4235 domain-containing protein [Arthrobacter sp. H14]|uniref:DUF4235 domain-containing protein n=1 Tax=Arthrobacter sp. H14 TaxID=1312959 RepID=UPI00047B440C|nr:DUF4235 domain-containing protein [Arthrobacter sp. H14]